jgi:hypothetical protein
MFKVWKSLNNLYRHILKGSLIEDPFLYADNIAYVN